MQAKPKQAEKRTNDQSTKRKQQNRTIISKTSTLQPYGLLALGAPSTAAAATIRF